MRVSKPSATILFCLMFWEEHLLIKRSAEAALTGDRSYFCAISFDRVCRYSREESFTALNIDIRNQQHLFESLDAFVKGDLLEGANAYHCEKCDKKVRISSAPLASCSD